MTTIVFILALLATVFEGVLAIPVIGGTIVIGTYYGALGATSDSPFLSKIRKTRTAAWSKNITPRAP